MQIFAIGYAGISFEHFIKLLKKKDIRTLVDVRRFPASKYKEFSKEKLSRLLRKEGIKYVHIVELGGFRGDYKDYVKTEEFRKGIKKLLKQSSPICLMCRERDPRYCHRRFIKQYLRRNGVKVRELFK